MILTILLIQNQQKLICFLLLGRKVDFAPPEADVHLRPNQPWSGGEASESTSVGGRAGSQMWHRTKMLKAEGLMANDSGSGF